MVSFNAALTSDYRYRGISQTRPAPALQVGADYAHNPAGLYAGTWLSLTNLFGFADSRRSGYLDLGANIDLHGGLTLYIPAGHQRVRHSGLATYAWKLGISKEWGVAAGGLALVGANANEAAYASPANGKFPGKAALVASIGTTF